VGVPEHSTANYSQTAFVNTLAARRVYHGAEFNFVALENTDGDRPLTRLFSRGSPQDLRA
jgi:hypothetical protein